MDRDAFVPWFPFALFPRLFLPSSPKPRPTQTMPHSDAIDSFGITPRSFQLRLAHPLSVRLHNTSRRVGISMRSSRAESVVSAESCSSPSPGGTRCMRRVNAQQSPPSCALISQISQPPGLPFRVLLHYVGVSDDIYALAVTSQATRASLPAVHCYQFVW